MTKEELKSWFIDKLTSCYPVVHKNYPECIFMYYDQQIIRKIKLSKISGVELKINNVTGVCLFKQDWKNKYIFCNYDEIWSFLELNYSSKYTNIQLLIMDILSEVDKMSVLTPFKSNTMTTQKLSEVDKMSVLIPKITSGNTYSKLSEVDNLSVLTPCHQNRFSFKRLSEVDKLSVLIPQNSEKISDFKIKVH